VKYLQVDAAAVHVLSQTHLKFLRFFLRVSRACLGKNDHFIGYNIKRGDKKWRLPHLQADAVYPGGFEEAHHVLESCLKHTGLFVEFYPLYVCPEPVSVKTIIRK
jgi:hypothetical protein